MVWDQMKEKLSFKIPITNAGKINTWKISNEMFEEICSFTPWIEDTSRKTLIERLYCIKHNLKDYPICEICSVNQKFWTNNRYSRSCSKECSIIFVTNKSKQTCLKKYGVENPFQSEEVKDKIKDTCLERYGFEHHLQNKAIYEKTKQTCQEKYGFDNPAQSEVVKQKTKDTCQEKYGFDNPAQSEVVKEKMKDTCQEKYGVEFAVQSTEVKEKSKQTSREKYGVENPAQSQEVKDKISISKAKHFSERRNNEGTDYSGVVYVLHFPQHSAVKIGLSGDFDQRAKVLLKDFGNFTIIDIIETESVFSLESSFHEKFSEYRFCLDEGCGRTEFFKDEILENFK
jgi:hypothetical protein